MADYNISTDTTSTTPPVAAQPTEIPPKPQSPIDQAKNAVRKVLDAVSGRKAYPRSAA